MIPISDKLADHEYPDGTVYKNLSKWDWTRMTCQRNAFLLLIVTNSNRPAFASTMKVKLLVSPLHGS